MPTDEELRKNGIGYLQFLREGVAKNITLVASGQAPANWEPETLPVPVDLLPLLRWRLEQIDLVLEHYRAGKPLNEAPPFLVGDWAEALDGGNEEENDEGSKS